MHVSFKFQLNSREGGFPPDVKQSHDMGAGTHRKPARTSKYYNAVSQCLKLRSGEDHVHKVAPQTNDHLSAACCGDMARLSPGHGRRSRALRARREWKRKRTGGADSAEQDVCGQRAAG